MVSCDTFRGAESDDCIGGVVAFDCNLVTMSVELGAVASPSLCSALLDLSRSEVSGSRSSH